VVFGLLQASLNNFLRTHSVITEAVQDEYQSVRSSAGAAGSAAAGSNFECVLRFHNQLLGRATGANKKKAREAASRNALTHLLQARNLLLAASGSLEDFTQTRK
jgi:hypothetical protein